MIGIFNKNNCLHFIVLFFSLMIGITALSSCVARTVSHERAQNIYQSDDYIIYLLQSSQTAESLAKKYLGDENKASRIEDANPGKTFSSGQYIIIPLHEKKTGENRGGISKDGYQVVPIITYHRFARECNSNLCMSKDIFEQQMKHLKENGYHTVTPEELHAFLDYRKAIPEKSVIITIDDGYRSVYEIAVPIMKKYGFTAIFFIYTDFVGVSKSAITWDQLREMKRDGFSIGSHSVTHCDLTVKEDGESDQDYLNRVKKELRDSKTIIDKELAQDTSILAYPFGKYDKRIIEQSIQSGYKMAMGISRGGNPFFNNPMSLRRVQVLSEDMNIFKSILFTFNRFTTEKEK